MTGNYKSKESVLVITVGFLLLYTVFKRKIFLDIALVIGLAGVLSTYLSERIDWAWNKLSLILSSISNTVLLTIIFLLVLTPIGLLRRALKKGSMTFFDTKKKSNFSDRPYSFTKKDLDNTW